jgi:hypothetical protein
VTQKNKQLIAAEIVDVADALEALDLALCRDRAVLSHSGTIVQQFDILVQKLRCLAAINVAGDIAAAIDACTLQSLSRRMKDSMATWDAI